MNTTTAATAATIATILDGLTLDGPAMWDYGTSTMTATVSAHSCHLAECAIVDALRGQGGTDWMPAADPAAIEIRRFLRSQACGMLSTGRVDAQWLDTLRAVSSRLRTVA